MTGFAKFYYKYDNNSSMDLRLIAGNLERFLRSFSNASKRRLRTSIWCVAPLLACLGPINSVADVFDVTAADVTTRALSAVWVSNEPISSATIRVFTDQDGLTDITSSITIVTDSELVNPAHAQGIAKVTATGLSADTSYFIQTETVSSSGVFTFPASPPFMQVHTALETTKVNEVNSPIANDLLSQEVFFPDGTTPAPGTLVLIEAEGVSAYPLTEFVGAAGFDAPFVAIDTNNFFGIDGRSLELQTDDVLRVTVFRGLLCESQFDFQSLIGFKRNPGHEESPAITELEVPPGCYRNDTICDESVNILDVQYVLNYFDHDIGSCGFNPAADVVADSQINILDVQSVLNDFGNSVPAQN